MRSLPVLTLCFLSLALHAKDKEGTPTTITTAKGDKITMDVKERSVHIVNSNTHRSITIGGDMPLKLNGQDIYRFKDHKEDEFSAAEYKVWADDYLKLNKAIDALLEEEKAKLPPGYYNYDLRHMVVDKKGYVAYYTAQKGLTRHVLNDDSQLVPAEMPAAVADAVDKKIQQAIANYRYTPFVYQHKATAYLNQYNYSFEIKGAQAPPKQLEKAISNEINKALKK